MRRTFLAVGLVAALGLSACSGDDDSATSSTAATTSSATPTSSATATTATSATTASPPVTTAVTTAVPYPATITFGGQTVTLPEQPTRIVSLSPTATEMLFAIGAGSQVIAVDDQSSYPADAPRSDLSGFTPNIEAIAATTPDLVVAANDTDGLMAGLAKLPVPALLLPAAATLDDTYAQMDVLGQATGHEADATKAIADMKAKIADLVAKVPARTAPLTYFHELDDTLYTVTSKTFIGNLYAMAGLQNVADAADKAGSGYPQLSAEYLVQQNPDLVFLADTKCCKQTAETVKARPGWGAMTAVTANQVIPLDDDIASRWGPRVVDFLQAIVDATSKVPNG